MKRKSVWNPGPGQVIFGRSLIVVAGILSMLVAGCASLQRTPTAAPASPLAANPGPVAAAPVSSNPDGSVLVIPGKEAGSVPPGTVTGTPMPTPEGVVPVAPAQTVDASRPTVPPVVVPAASGPNAQPPVQPTPGNPFGSNISMEKPASDATPEPAGESKPTEEPGAASSIQTVATPPSAEPSQTVGTAQPVGMTQPSSAEHVADANHGADAGKAAESTSPVPVAPGNSPTGETNKDREGVFSLPLPSVDETNKPLPGSFNDYTQSGSSSKPAGDFANASESREHDEPSSADVDKENGTSVSGNPAPSGEKGSASVSGQDVPLTRAVVEDRNSETRHFRTVVRP